VNICRRLVDLRLKVFKDSGQVSGVIGVVNTHEEDANQTQCPNDIIAFNLF